MQCNIDARGKAVRLVIGGVLALAGATLLALHLWQTLPSLWAMYAGIVLLIAGGFGIFEGWAGWCAMRAMGFRTKM